MNRFLAALRFLTIFPVPGSWGSAEEDLARSVPCFPLVGLLLGGLGAATAWALDRFKVPAMLAALALVVLLLGFSGCLHLDGLSDSADGLFSSRSRDRMLEIMKDSHVGPMGVVAVLVILLAKFSALASMPAQALLAGHALDAVGRPGGDRGPPGLAPLRTAWRPGDDILSAIRQNVRRAASRSCLPGRTSVVPLGKRDLLGRGLGSTLLALVGWGLFGLRGLAIGGVALAAMLVSAGYLKGKLGGITGDTLGAVERASGDGAGGDAGHLAFEPREVDPMSRHGGNLRALALRAGCRPEEILDFSASVNPLGPPESLRAVDQPEYRRA